PPRTGPRCRRRSGYRPGEARETAARSSCRTEKPSNGPVEDDERPEPITVVPATCLREAIEKPADLPALNTDAVQPRRVGQLIAEEAGDRTREPRFQGNGEALLRSREDVRGYPARERALEQELGLAIAEPEVRG